MGTKLRDYLEGEGRPKTAVAARRRQDLARAYTLAVDLIELRHSQGLTQQELADRSGVAQSEISRIERGAIHPTDTTWARLAEALSAQIRMVPAAAPRRTATAAQRTQKRQVAAR